MVLSKVHHDPDRISSAVCNTAAAARHDDTEMIIFSEGLCVSCVNPFRPDSSVTVMVVDELAHGVILWCDRCWAVASQILANWPLVARDPTPYELLVAVLAARS
jgi:hypothetical protein